MKKEISIKKHDIKLILFIFIISFLLRLFFITQSPLIYGDDGPYYLIHTENTLNGTEYNFESIIFYFFSLFAIIFNDLTLGIKIAASLLSAAIVVPIFLIVHHITKDKDSAFIAALLATMSPINYNILAQTLKEVGGLLIGTTLIYFVLKSFDGKTKSRQNISLIFILTILLNLIHLSSTFYFISFISLSLLIIFFYTKKIKNDESGKRSLFILGVILSAILLSFLLRYLLQSHISIENFLSFQDFFRTTINESSFSFYTIHYLYIFYLPFIFIFLFNIYSSGSIYKHQILLLVWLLISFILSSSLFISSDWSWRFARMSHILMIILASVTYPSIRRWNGFYAFLLLTTLLIWESATFISSGLVFGPIISESEYQFLVETKSLLPKNAVIISECGVYSAFPCKEYWLVYAGFVIKNKNEITDQDDPYLFVEIPLDSKYNYYYSRYNFNFSLSNCGECGEIVSSFGRFAFVKFVS
ncbi:MAG: hypothetical protein QW783_03440 [Candidatus Micrarchaeia archaeon]